MKSLSFFAWCQTVGSCFNANMADSGTENDEKLANLSRKPNTFIIYYWMAKRKIERSTFQDFLDRCSKNPGMILKCLDLDDEDCLGKSEKIDLLIHHNPEELVQEVCLEKINKFIKAHPRITVMDPIESVQTLLCRIDTIQALTHIFKDSIFQVPETINVSHLCSQGLKERHNAMQVIMNEGKLQYPILAKRLKSKDHQMVLVCGDDGLLTLAAFIEKPSLLQQFKAHSHVMYKIKMYGANQYQIQKRNSLSVSDSKTKTVEFCSSDISRHKVDPSRKNEKDGCSHCGVMPLQKMQQGLLLVVIVVGSLMMQNNSRVQASRRDIRGADNTQGAQSLRYRLRFYHAAPGPQVYPQSQFHSQPQVHIQTNPQCNGCGSNSCYKCSKCEQKGCCVGISSPTPLAFHSYECPRQCHCLDTFCTCRCGGICQKA